MNSTFDELAWLYGVLPVWQAATALFLISGVMLGLGLLAIHWVGKGSTLRSTALRGLLISILLVCVLYEVAYPWLSNTLAPITTTSSPITQSVTTVMANRYTPIIRAEHEASLIKKYQNSGALFTPVIPDSGPTQRLWPPFTCLIEVILTACWIGIAFGITLRQILGRLLIARICSRADRALHPDVVAVFTRMLPLLGLDNKRLTPRLVASPRVASPFVSGLFRSTVVLPSACAESWTAPELEAALAHELAHVKRRDLHFQLLADVLCAFVWFQPLAWVLHRKLEDAAEDVCDQEVLRVCGGAPVYAGLLLRIAEGRVNAMTERVAGIGLAPNTSAVGRRVAAILRGFDAKLLSIGKGSLIVQISALTVLAACVLMSCTIQYAPWVWKVPVGYLDQFTLTKQEGWDIGPIAAYASVLSPRNQLTASTLLFQVSPLCVLPPSLRRVSGAMFGAGGPDPSLNSQLNAYVTAHPEDYLAQYMLASWLSESGQPMRARALVLRSLALAPHVLAGRLQYADGAPASHVTESGTFSFIDARHQGSGLLETWTYQFVTDQNGCYYLPVPDAVIRPISRGHFLDGHVEEPGHRKPDLLDWISPRLPPAFVCPEKVCVLPPEILQSYLPLSVNGVWATQLGIGSSAQKPISARGPSLHLAWPAYPNAVKYTAALYEYDLVTARTYMMGPVWNMGRAFNMLGDIRAPSIDLTMEQCPGLCSGKTYRVDIEALGTDGHVLASSVSANFRLPDVPRSIKLTPANFLAIEPPDTRIVSYRQTPDTVTIDYVIPQGGLPDTLNNPLPFDWKFVSQTSSIRGRDPLMREAIFRRVVKS